MNTLQIKNFETYYYPLDKASPVWKQEYSLNDIYQPNNQRYSHIRGVRRVVAAQHHKQIVG